MKVLFLRHGQTATNVKAALHRRDDIVDLDEVGVRQAKALAKLCTNEGVQQIFSSPELRARHTAEIIGDSLGLSVAVLPELSERDWGEWAGQTWDDIEAKLQTMDLAERYTFVPPKGESWQQMEERLRLALQKVSDSAVKVVAVVTHGGALRALMPILKNEPKETSFNYDFKNASTTSFEHQGDTWQVIAENDVGHLASN